MVRQPEILFEDAALRTIMTVCTMIIDYCLPMTLPHSTFSCCHHCSCPTGGRCTPSNHNFYFANDNNFYNDDNQMLHFDDNNTQMQPESPGRPSIFPPQLQSPKTHWSTLLSDSPFTHLCAVVIVANMIFLLLDNILIIFPDLRRHATYSAHQSQQFSSSQLEFDLIIVIQIMSQ